MSIRVENISKFYGAQKALDNVSFAAEKGQVVGFLGPNGAGKSTMMKILTSYIQPSEGKASVNGFHTQENPIAVKKSIGYLPEHNPLYLDMYIREYLRFNAGIYKVSKARTEEIIEMTGLSPEANKKIGQLSKGYRQRVGLAAALLHNPEVLILDEPTTGLDPNQLVEIRELIKNIGKDKTVFLSTHIMQEVEAICDRVIIIKKGKIVADNKLQQIFNNENDQIIEVEFDLKVETEFIQRIEHLKSFRNIHDMQWEFVFNADKDMRPTLFDFAQEMGIKILSMQLKNKNLETIFREKTV